MELVAGIVVVVVAITLCFEISQAKWRRDERAAGDPRLVAPDLRLLIGGRQPDAGDPVVRHQRQSAGGTSRLAGRPEKVVAVPAWRRMDEGEGRDRPRSA